MFASAPAVDLARPSKSPVRNGRTAMKRIVGVVAGLGLLLLAVLSYRNASGGWAEGHSDIGFWWTVIGSLLGIAGLSAVVGTTSP